MATIAQRGAARGGWRTAGREAAGGIVTTVVSLALALSFGLIAYTGATHALGARAVDDHAAAAGLLSAIIGMAFGALTDRAGRSMYGPRSSTTVLLATLVVGVAADPALPRGDTARLAAFLVGTAGVCVALAGVLQIVFAIAGIGRLARYVPYPFLAGFMCGIAGLIVIRQLPLMLGLGEVDLSGAHALVGSVEVGAMLVGIATLGAINVVKHRWSWLPALPVGLVAGIVFYLVLAGSVPSLDFGAGIAEMDRVPPITFLPSLLPSHDFRLLLARHAGLVATTAVLLATLGGMDGLLSAVAVDSATDGERDSRTELLRHGVVNLACGLVGALPVALSPNNVVAAWRAGARTRAPGFVAAALLALVLLRGGNVLRAIPEAVLAGVMLAVAASLVDHWTRGMVRRLRSTHGRDRGVVTSLAVVALVALATILTSMLTAVLTGLLLSMVQLVATMHASLVRSIVDGNVRPSRRIWTGATAMTVAALRARMRIVELEGALFFGTAERLAGLAALLSRDADWIVLDFARVSTIDATGALLLERLARRLRERGAHLLLAGVTPEGRHGSALVAYGTFAAADKPWFADVDRAVEHAELAALSSTGQAPADVPLRDMEIAAGLAPAALEALGRCLETVTLATGQVLFREGDPGDRLYLIARGSVTVHITLPNGGQSRIATFAPGSVFGETALLDGRPRSGTALAAEDAVLLVLTGAALARLRADDPAVASALFENLARVLALRVRTTTNALRQLEDTFG